MSTELDLYNASDLQGRQHYALQLARAGTLLPKGVREGVNPTDFDTIAARTFLQMETGSMLGLHPIAALLGINVIEGQPSLKPALMSALVLQAGHKVRRTEVGTVEGGDLAVTVTVVRSDDEDHPTSVTWTPHRAARAGLCRYEQGNDGIWRVIATASRTGAALPWQSYTEALCFARALSEAARIATPDALFGIGYTPEELGAEVDASGEVISVVGESTQQRDEQAKPARKPKGTRTGQQGTRNPAAAAKPEQTPEPATGEPEQVPASPAAYEGTPMPTADPGDGMTWARNDEGLWATVADPNAMPGPSAEDMAQQGLDERAEREALAAEQAANAERLEREAEQVVDAEVVPDEDVPPPSDDDVPMWADPDTGEVPDEPNAPSAYELAVSESPDDYERRGLAATLHTQLKDTWMRADRAGALTPELKALLQGRKTETTDDLS